LYLVEYARLAVIVSTMCLRVNGSTIAPTSAIGSQHYNRRYMRQKKGNRR
jgi:hypothetical protein